MKAARAVVSVGFSRDDLERVAAHARQHGMKTSEFIRQAAIDRAAPRQPRAVVVSVTGAVRTSYLRPGGAPQGAGEDGPERSGLRVCLSSVPPRAENGAARHR